MLSNSTQMLALKVIQLPYTQCKIQCKIDTFLSVMLVLCTMCVGAECLKLTINRNELCCFHMTL